MSTYNVAKLLVDINTCMFHVIKGQRYATIVLFVEHVEDAPCFVIYDLKINHEMNPRLKNC